MGMDPSVARITKDDTVVRVGYRAAPGPGQLFMDDIVPTAAPLAVGGLSQERLDQRDSLGPIDSRRLLGAFPDHNNPCRPPGNQQQSGSDTTRLLYRVSRYFQTGGSAGNVYIYRDWSGHRLRR